MQLTIDSSEPLDHVLRVVESLYGVQLTTTADQPTGKNSATARAPKSRARRTRAAKTAAKPVVTARRSGGRAKNDPASIRTWARANGHPIRDRGRVPAAVLAAYQSSTKSTR